MRSNVLVVAAWGLLVGVAPGALAEPPEAVVPLAQGIPIERDLSTGQTHSYRVSLPAGHFVRISIEQRGIDVAAALVGPDERELLSVDAADDVYRPEMLVAIAHSEGDHRITVRPAPDSPSPGRYAIRVDELRLAEPGDEVLIGAERAYERGRKLRLSRQPAAYPRALAEFGVALDGYRQVADRRGEAKALIEISVTRNFSALPDALAPALQAEQIAREIEDRAATAAALTAAGMAQARGGDLAADLLAQQESAAISHALGNSRAESVALMEIGVVHGRSGDAEKAVSDFERVLVLDRAANALLMQALDLNNLGIAYKDLGEYEKSLSAYDQSLAMIRATTPANLEDQAMCLNNMGNLQRLLRNDEKALELHTQALALSRQSGGKATEARSLNTLGLTYYSLGDDEKALEYHRQSLALRRQLQDLPGQAASLDGMGRALTRLGRHDEALAALKEALTIRHDVREQYGEPDTLRNLAVAERDRGHLAEALADIKAAVDLDETLRERITSPEVRSTFIAAKQDKCELFIDLLQQQHLADPSAGHDADALGVSERARARVLLESLLDGRVDLRQGIEPALLERERSLQKQLSQASAQLSRSLAKRPGPDQATAAAETLDRLSADYRQLQTQIRAQSPRYAALTQLHPLTAREIQRTVVDDETVLLEFALGDQRSWLWAVTPDTLTSLELPRRSAIDEGARRLYERFTARQHRPGETSGSYARRVAAATARLDEEAAAMSRMLFGGLAGRLDEEWRGKRLAIVASGPLEYLPFAALPLPVDGRAPSVPHRAAGVPLIVQHEIVRLPSASVLAALRSEIAGRTPARGAIAVLADPVFEAADPRVNAGSAGRAPSAKSGGVAVADMTYHLNPRAGLARLPFSRDEARAIASLGGAGEVFEAVDFRASRETALDPRLRDYRIVHFATHGVLDSERPSLSGLVFSLVDERGGSRDGYLRLPDIYNMRLGADLVVLSACQTALGKEIKGEGLIGLTRAFMYAGAPRLVASLWEVSDLATAELMKRFYAAMLRRGLRPSAALRAAQLEMSHDARWASPYFWAGFVLQGDWR